jgi:hypothetical protein
LLVGACAHNPYAPAWKAGARYDAYERYRPTPVEIAQLRESYAEQKAANPRLKPADTVRTPYLKVAVTDLDVVLYADHVRNILATKFTNARFARYTSATVQVLLAGGAGLAAAFSGGTTVVAGLAFGSAATPEISRIFNARERAGLYRRQAVQIDLALKAYADARDSGTPNDTKLTPEGRALYVAIVTALNAVDAGLEEVLPDVLSQEQVEALRKEVTAENKAILAELKEIRQVLRAKPDPSPTPAAAPATPPTTPAPNEG